MNKIIRPFLWFDLANALKLFSAMCTFQGTRFTIPGTTLTAIDTAHIATISTAGLSLYPASTHSESNTVGVNSDWLHFFKQLFINNVSKPINFKYLIVFCRLLQRDTKSTNTTTTKVDKYPYRGSGFAFKMLFHQFCRTFSDCNHGFPRIIFGDIEHLDFSVGIENQTPIDPNWKQDRYHMVEGRSWGKNAGDAELK